MSKQTLNHMPWDNGAISDSFETAVGFYISPKTTKTRCGVRVVSSKANHKQTITCESCLEDMKTEEKFKQMLYQTKQ